MKRSMRMEAWNKKRHTKKILENFSEAEVLLNKYLVFARISSCN